MRNARTRSAASAFKKRIPIVGTLRWVNKGMRAVTSKTHQAQFIVEWGVDNPEYFDHFLDQHYKWKVSRESFPWERGVLSSLALKPKAKVLDLCCGDGFNSYHFYSLRAESVTAIDFDANAIQWAKRNFKAENLEYIVGDIRTSIPDGPFDNIIWDAAVEHFTEDEIIEIMKKITSALSMDGTLSGYTVAEPDHGGKHLHQHEYEFESKEDLARFLTPYFNNVHVFSTVYPSRTNLYFYASNSQLPFSRDWNLYLSNQESQFSKKSVVADSN